MHISVEKAPFLKVLGHGQSVVEKKTTVPIISTVLLHAVDGQLSVTATDMDMALIERIPVEVKVAGSVCVSASLLHDIVKKLNDKKVIDLTVSDDGSRLFIVSGRSRFDMGCLPVEDFPQLVQSEITHRFTLPAPVFRHLIDSTRFCMAVEETRYYLNGIHFHAHEEGGVQYLRAVATDMHRLACVECEAPEGVKDMPQVIIARKTVQEIRKLLDDAEAPIQIGLSSTRVEFNVQGAGYDAVLTARLVEGTFPEYQAAILVENDKSLIVLTKSFAESIDRVGTVVTNDKLRAIRLSACDNQATLSAVSQDYGSAIEEMDVDFAYTDKVDVCFNVRYMMEVAQQINTEEMELLLLDSDSSLVIKPVGNPHMVFILMPMEV
ncbi:MAG: DNA polymerase III subunit beta [Pseudomonadota bacterium]